MLCLSQGYQFWTQTDANGKFIINNIRQGRYNLYAWVPGFIGDYKFDKDVEVLPGLKIFFLTEIHDVWVLFLYVLIF